MGLSGRLMVVGAFHWEAGSARSHHNTNPGYLAKIPGQSDNDSITTLRREGYGEEEAEVACRRQVQGWGF